MYLKMIPDASARDRLHPASLPGIIRVYYSGNRAAPRSREKEARMAGRTADKLTEKAIRAVRPGPKARKISDGHGLYLWVPPKGSMSWRYAYSWQGKEKTLSIGTWPEVSLAEARTAHAEARRQLASGISPADAKREATIARPQADSPTFGRLAEDYLARIAGYHAQSTVTTVRCVLATRVLPSLGDRRADGIRRMDVMAALAPLVDEGKLCTWRKARGIIGRVFRHGMATGHELMDPTAGLQGAVAAPRTVPRAAVLEPEDVGKLMLAIEGMRDGSMKAAMSLLPYVFTRPGELCRAEWREIDLEGRMWTIPAERMKAGREHLVPLSDQAAEILAGQRTIYGNGRFVFPSARVPGAPVTRGGLLSALREMGYSEAAMSLHGFRSTASTILNRLGYNPDWIERQLAHSDRNRVRAAYNRADYIEERKGMMQAYADRLDSLKEEAREAAGR
jgi:integrase